MGAGGDDSGIRKPFLNTGSWYRMGSRQSSLVDRMGESSAMMRDSSVSVLVCTMIVALGPIQFGFTVSSQILKSIFVRSFVRAFIIRFPVQGGFCSPTQNDMIRDLGLTLSEVKIWILNFLCILQTNRSFGWKMGSLTRSLSSLC